MAFDDVKETAEELKARADRSALYRDAHCVKETILIPAGTLIHVGGIPFLLKNATEIHGRLENLKLCDPRVEPLGWFAEGVTPTWRLDAFASKKQSE